MIRWLGTSVSLPRPAVFRARRTSASGLVLASLALATPALAQAQQASAETLFREGVRLLDAGKTTEACAKFEESQRADPALGTLINLATCHEKAGRTASAWVEFSQAASQAGQLKQQDREQLARTHVKALEKQLRHIALHVEKAAPHMDLTIDGQPIVEAAWSTPFPVDPGEHRLEASAPGRKPWRQTFAVAASAGSDRLDVPMLEAEPSSVVAVTPTVALQPATLETKPEPAPLARTSTPPDAGSETANTKRTVGFIVGGLGVVTLGVSGYFWLHTSSLDSDRKAADDRNDRPTADSLRSDALSSQTVAAVTSGIGAVALGTGLVLVLTSKRASSTNGWAVAPSVGKNRSGMNLRGVW